MIVQVLVAATLAAAAAEAHPAILLVLDILLQAPDRTHHVFALLRELPVRAHVLLRTLLEITHHRPKTADLLFQTRVVASRHPTTGTARRPVVTALRTGCRGIIGGQHHSIRAVCVPVRLRGPRALQRINPVRVIIKTRAQRLTRRAVRVQAQNLHRPVRVIDHRELAGCRVAIREKIRHGAVGSLEALRNLPAFRVIRRPKVSPGRGTGGTGPQKQDLARHGIERIMIIHTAGGEHHGQRTRPRGIEKDARLRDIGRGDAKARHKRVGGGSESKVLVKHGGRSADGRENFGGVADDGFGAADNGAIGRNGKITSLKKRRLILVIPGVKGVTVKTVRGNAVHVVDIDSLRRGVVFVLEGHRIG
ncbi:MAG: hypothetical protein BWY49_00525 [Candidatus Omnitrophica bacterium ADurb.Bin314]|nr:MAG: hypothetical protein BWY49_00525 [Candidatus Omnitrophica bacterium ADurb.Bin314]